MALGRSKLAHGAYQFNARDVAALAVRSNHPNTFFSTRQDRLHDIGEPLPLYRDLIGVNAHVRADAPPDSS